MNTYSRTLPMPGVARPVREAGSSALDRAPMAWPVPDPALRVTDLWAAPSGSAVFRVGTAPWAAPDPMLRIDLPAPTRLAGPRTELVEPTLPVPLPDLVAASRVAMAPLEEVTPTASTVSTLPPPVLADAAPVSSAPTADGGTSQVADAAVIQDRSGVTARVMFGLVAAAGVVAAGTVALFAIF